MKGPKIKNLVSLSKRELANDFYPLFQRLMEKGFQTEAFLLMISTWNFASFRYAWKSFNLIKFEEKLARVEPLFRKFSKTNFKTINFGEYKEEIKKIYNTLSSIPGVGKTGSTKLMHLKVPQTFVMWDDRIRHHYDCANKEDCYDYLKFLKLMQDKFGHLPDNQKRTLAKRIDEHNYQTITESALNKAKRSRKVLSRS